MESIGTAVLTLTTDSSKFNQGLDKAQGRAQAFGNRMKSWGKTMSMRVSAPLAAAGVAAVKFASDLQESANAVNVVFEDAAGTIERFGETATRTVGLAQADFNEMATVIGAQLKQSGADIDTVGEQTINLTKRAADLASVFNTSVKDATNALGSALRGEAEPARRFGVNISQVAIQAQAVADGMIKAGEEMTEQQKIQARLSLIMKQSAGVAGDFQNTSDDLANSMRIAWAEIKNAAAQFGDVLVPAVTAAVGWVRDAVGVFGNLSGTSKTLIVVMGLLAAAIPPLTIAIGTMLTVLGTGVTIITGGIIPAIGLLTAAAIAIIEHWEPISRFFADMWDSVVDSFKGAIDWIKNTAMDAWRGYADLMIGIVDKILGATEKIGGALGFDVSKIQAARRGLELMRDGMEQTTGATRSWAEEVERGDTAMDKYTARIDGTDWGAFAQQAQDRAEAEQAAADATEAKETAEEGITAQVKTQAELRKDMFSSIAGRLRDAAARTTVFAEQLGRIGDVEGSLAQALGSREEVYRNIVSLTEGISVELAIQESSAEGLKGWQEKLLELYKEAQEALSDSADETERQESSMLRMLDMPLSQMLDPSQGALGSFAELGQASPSQNENVASGATGPLDGVLATIEDVGAAFAPLVSSISQVTAVMNPLQTILKAAMDVLGGAIADTLQPLVEILTIIGRVLGTLLRPAFEMLARYTTHLGKVFVWLHDWIIRPIGNFLISIFERVANFIIGIFRKVVKALNKIPGVNIKKPKKVSFGRIEKIGKIGSEDTSEDTTGAGAAEDSAATIEQERPITVNMTISDNQIAGDGSFRDLAITIRRELEALGAINA